MSAAREKRRKRKLCKTLQETARLRRKKERVEEERRTLEAKLKEEEKGQANEQMALERQKQAQLQEEKLRWKKVMTVEEEPIMRPISAVSDLKKEQQRRLQEVELCCKQRPEDKAGAECPAAEAKSPEH